MRSTTCEFCDGSGVKIVERMNAVSGPTRTEKPCSMCDGMGFDCQYTDDELVCPYCGYCHQDDLNEYAAEDDGQFECGSCQKTFRYTGFKTHTYSSQRADCLNGGQCDWARSVIEDGWLRCRNCSKRKKNEDQDVEKNRDAEVGDRTSD